MKLVVLSSIAAIIIAASAQSTYTNCSGNHDASYCAGPSLNTSTILRCSESSNDTPQPGNCADNLVEFGGESGAAVYCWQTSNTTGDAQCTANCVRVTAANGTSFYPVGCNSTSGNQTVASGAPSSTVLSSAGESSSIASATGAPSSISLSTAATTASPSLVASASAGAPTGATGSSAGTSAHANTGLLGSPGICSAMCGLGMLLLT